ncbi:Galactokinase gal [Mycena sanguinolenta]|uniref:Galactokinase n=1 Tax=Mycena sanguinolenta TaxID=230812 RepID=A0A8H7DIC9_9AGAR|nr:Galactokinase gal [Mycena sanguinolenta]
MSAQEAISVYTNLTDLYSSLGTSLNHAERWDNLAEEFEKRFGKKPTYIARAPGRVNLIGEHIDYALFGVLPAAIERDILIACAPRDVPPSSPTAEAHHAPGSVIAENLHPKYTRQIFAPTPKNIDNEVHIEGWHLDIPQQLRWENYVKAGYYGVLDEHFTGGAALPIPVDLLVTGSVPAGSGLSSSAAMVVASTLAFLAINGKLEGTEKVAKGELVKMSMENEKRVGVNKWTKPPPSCPCLPPSYTSPSTPPLTASPTPLPGGAVLVCAHSLKVSDKALTAKRGYNLRVVETLVGARALAVALGIPLDPREKITYREVVGRLANETDVGKGGAGMNVDALMEVLARVIASVEQLKPPGSTDPEFGATMEEMVALSGLSKEEFHEVYMSWVEVDATHFKLYKRAKHVYSEALRVLQFRKLCLDTAAAPADDNLAVLKQLGNLMNESQTSCADDFECSCEELDLLTRLAREAGAYGSRLTVTNTWALRLGAGWGGCTVSLVPEAEVDSFIKKVSETYPPYKGLTGEALSEVIFATRPSTGACGACLFILFSSSCLLRSRPFCPLYPSFFPFVPLPSHCRVKILTIW